MLAPFRCRPLPVRHLRAQSKQGIRSNTAFRGPGAAISLQESWLPHPNLNVRVCSARSGRRARSGRLGLDPGSQILGAEDRGEEIEVAIVCRQPVLIGKTTARLDELDVLVVGEGTEVVADLGERPRGIGTDLAALKDHLLGNDALRIGFVGDVLLDELQQLSGRPWQIIEGVVQHAVGEQLVSEPVVGDGALDVFEGLAAVQRQLLAACAGTDPGSRWR